MIGAPPALQQIPSGGKIPATAPKILRESAFIHPFGAAVFLSEIVFRADTTGLLVRTAAGLVISAAAALADAVFALIPKNPNLSDGQPWLIDGVNLGTPAALDSTSLSAALAGLRRQKMGEIQVSPQARFLLCGPDDELTAHGLIRDFPLSLTVVADARLDGAGFGLFSNPAEFPAAGRLALAGYEKPTISVKAGFREVGLGYSVTFDCGAAALSRVGAYWIPPA